MAMKRKVRISEESGGAFHYDFKDDVIKDILYQIDYQTAFRNKVVSVSEKEMANELKKLSTGVLTSWYLAYIYIRRELMHAGYELNGLKVFDAPLDTISEVMSKNPDFDINSYIF